MVLVVTDLIPGVPLLFAFPPYVSPCLVMELIAKPDELANSSKVDVYGFIDPTVECGMSSSDLWIELRNLRESW